MIKLTPRADFRAPSRARARSIMRAIVAARIAAATITLAGYVPAPDLGAADPELIVSDQDA